MARCGNCRCKGAVDGERHLAVLGRVYRKSALQVDGRANAERFSEKTAVFRAAFTTRKAQDEDLTQTRHRERARGTAASLNTS